MRWVLVIGGILLVLLLIINITVIVRKILYPPPPDYPDVLFGKLPPFEFPESPVKEQFTYTVDTISGVLPVFPDRINVYKTAVEPITLLNIQTAREKAQSVGFIDEPDKQYREFELGANKYQWQVVTNDLLRTIVMNTETYDFKMTSTYKTYPPILNQSQIGNETKAKEIVVSFLRLMKYPLTDINLDKTKVQSLMIKNGILLPADTVSNTHIMRVDLYQQDIDKLPVFYPTHPLSALNFLVMGRTHNLDDILEANFYHQVITQEVAEYPLKTAQEAYADLAAGKAYVSNYTGISRTIPITDVSLGYYFGEKRQDFALPVIFFQSKDNFYAFVPAIKETCLTTSSSSIDECQGKPLKAK